MTELPVPIAVILCMEEMESNPQEMVEAALIEDKEDIKETTEK